MSPTHSHEGIEFAYIDEGSGAPFAFQHGLGGDVSQPRSLWGETGRLISMDCRGHGSTDPLGPQESLTFGSFAADLAALIDSLGIENLVLGGVSMGAGVALRLAYEQPQRVKSLVLVRPAWFTSAAPANLRAMPEIARLLSEHGPDRGRELFLRTGIYRETLAESAGAAESLLGQFHRSQAVDRAPVLERIAHDRPLPAKGPWPALTMPTLIIATSEDPLHPLSCAQAWAEALPHVTLERVTPRYVDGAGHAREVAAAIDAFLA